jgi:hypothetical protein
MDILLILLILFITFVFTVYTFIDVLWDLLFRNTEDETLKVHKVPEGRGWYFQGKSICGQVSQTFGPDEERPNPLRGRNDYHFAFEVTTQEGQTSTEWLWSNELEPGNMEAYSGRSGALYIRVTPNQAEDVIRDQDAMILTLEQELKEHYDSSTNKTKILYDSVH